MTGNATDTAIDTAITVTKFVGNTAALASKIGGTALPVAQFFAGFIPGLAPAIQILTVATPIIAKIATAAPVAAELIKQGRPVIEAMQEAGPNMLPSLKQLYAIAVNGDPAQPEKNMTADQVSDDIAASFGAHIVGVDPPGWTHEETIKWWERDSAH